MNAFISQVAGNGGLEKIVVRHPAADGEVYLHGAHVTHWQPAGEDAVLFLSPSAVFRQGKAIRGGIPVCLPWFGRHPTDADAPAHGFVRTAVWQLVRIDESDLGVSVRLRFDATDHTNAHWTHPFTAELAVTFGRTLTLSLAVTNTGDVAFAFQEALHTYFRVGEVRDVRVVGLTGATYLDKTDGYARKRDDAQTITFASETDRAYVDTIAECRVVDPRLNRQIVVEKDVSKSTIVWNPFEKKAAAQVDIGDAWPGFVCVESANVGEDAVTIEPAETHTLHVHVRIEPLEAT